MSDVQGGVADDDRIVFRVKVEYSYETTGADLKKYYDTTDLTEAATIDTNNLYDDPQFIADDLAHRGKYTVTINAARFSGAK